MDPGDLKNKSKEHTLEAFYCKGGKEKCSGIWRGVLDLE